MKASRIRNVLLGVALASLLGTASAGREPFRSGTDFKPALGAEALAWDVSAVAYKENVRRRAVTNDYLPLEAYLTRVAYRIFPEFEGKLRIRVFPELGCNAFAMPDGSVYVGGGILVRMTNEAQLAALLGHEITHVTHRHGVESAEDAEVTGGLINVLQVAVAVVPLPVSSLTQLAVHPFMRLAGQFGVGFTLTSSMYGFNRAREAEADEEGFRRMVAAGYEATEATKFFQGLADEAAVTRRPGSFFFSSHPAMTSRVDAFKTLAAKHAKKGDVGEASFDAAVRPYRARLIQREMTVGGQPEIIALLERPEITALFEPGEGAFLRGEARRKNGDDDSALKALADYKEALDKGYSPDRAREARVLIHLRLKQGKAAKQVIQDWVAAGKSQDDLDIKEYLERANKYDTN